MGACCASGPPAQPGTDTKAKQQSAKQGTSSNVVVQVAAAPVKPPYDFKSKWPGYVDNAVVNKTTQQLCLASWQKVLKGESKVLQDSKRASSPASHFYEVYYEHLNQVCPGVRDVFSWGGIHRKSKALLRLVATLLSLSGEVKEQESLSQIAQRHCTHIGVSVEFYIPTLQVLITALRECLGECWNSEFEQAWLTTCSAVLKTMVPVAIDFHKPVVVIIGSGYGGIVTANALDQGGKFRVVVLDRKGYFFHNIAALRAAVVKDYVNETMFPYHKLLNHGSAVVCDVLEVKPDGIIIHGRDKPMRYDYCVIATGSSYAFPAKLAAVDRKDVVSLYRQTYDTISQAKRIVIVGGGPVGCELAGEIKAYFPDKSVVLIHRREKLSSGYMEADFSDLVAKYEKGMGVELCLGDEAVIESKLLEAYKEVEKVHYLTGEQTVRTKSGREFKCDLIFLCTGTHVNSKVYEKLVAPEHLDKAHRIKVNEFCQVPGYKNIFAVGDITSGYPMLASFASMQAQAVAPNIERLAAGKPMEPFQLPTTKPQMVVTVGNKVGVGRDKWVTNDDLTDDDRLTKYKAWDAGVGFLRSKLGIPPEYKWHMFDWTPVFSEEEDIKALVTSMHISESEAVKLLSHGIESLQRPARDTYT